MQSLAELERAVSLLRPRLLGARLRKVRQSDACSLVLDCEAERGAHLALLLCCDPERGRLSCLEELPAPLAPEPTVPQYLRAHALGARIAAFELADGDRRIEIVLRGGERECRLLLALMGRRSNLYLVDAQGLLVAALRPLAQSRPDLVLGAPLTWPDASAPRAGDDRFSALSDAEFFAALEAASADEQQRSAQEGLSARVGRLLRREQHRSERKRESLEQERAAAEADLALQAQGELLKTQLARVVRGAASVEVVDPASGATQTIALDPALGPAENLERLFKRYRKAVRTLAKLGDSLARLDVGLREGERRLAEFERIGGDAAALQRFVEAQGLAERLSDTKGPAPTPKGAPGAKPPTLLLGGREVPRRLAPKRYRTSGGLEVWVGRSAEANDFLSTRLARGNDLFLHLSGGPGSHVILRTEGRTDPPSEDLLEACELAVHNSKFKDASRVEVHVVPIKNVKKPKGAKPGLVHVHGGKNIGLRRDPARLERVLAARIED